MSEHPTDIMYYELIQITILDNNYTKFNNFIDIHMFPGMAETYVFWAKQYHSHLVKKLNEML